MMDNLIQRLPQDTLDRIIAYSYQPQPTSLCSDIRSYHKISDKLISHYQEIHKDLPLNPPDDSFLAWLSNDISRFLNNDIATMYGYSDFYLEVYKRLRINQTKDHETMKDVVYDIDMNSNSVFPRDIKVTIGLLTPSEREGLVTFLGSITPGSLLNDS